MVFLLIPKNIKKLSGEVQDERCQEVRTFNS